MSFGGFGSSGFGSTNNNNNTSGSLFGGGGGFGSNNNNTTGGFGSGTGAFGSTNNNTTTGGFGGFGSTANNNTSGGFGSAAKPMFGGTTTNTGGGLFGSSNNNNASTGAFGSGGFGSNNNTTTSTFGSGTTNSLFAPKTNTTSAFGNNTGGGLFGNSTGSTFGNNTTSTVGAFGAGASSAECQGTASPAYTATTDKEGTTTNSFQSIVHMPAYSKFSFEELRLADYNAGRKTANASGQAGGFGTSTGFGGFNNQASTNPFGANNNTTTTGGGLFGNNNTSTNTGFGSNNTTGSAFGGGFGAAKPTTSLFGATNNTTTSNTGGSLFGGNTGGFGTNTNTTTNAFGTNNNTGFGANNAAKPSIFGNTNSASNTGTSLFGNTNNNTNTGGGLFGNNNNQNQSTGFGNNQNTASSNPFGAANNTGGGLFGNNNNQTKTTSLFGNTPAANTGTSLFGNTQTNNQQGGSLFGNNNNNTGSSLFGAKPATTSLFGQPQQQQQTTSLFGNTQPAQPAGGSLFGNSASKPATSLFGNSTTQNNMGGSSLFGNSQTQAQQNSLFGGSQQNVLQPPQGLTASIMDQRPYGSISIFDGLPPAPTQSVGPIATPIRSGQKQAKPAVLPQWKINPTMSPRFTTPQKPGYGFSYSRYGTPSSISSVASTPGHFGASLLGSSMGHNMGKSVSVSNLRRQYIDDAESVLAPGAFSGSTRLNGGHSLKKLNIDRSLRNDLFAPVAHGPYDNKGELIKSSTTLKKRVSFDTSNQNNTDEEPLRITNTDTSPTPTAQEQGYLRSSNGRNLFNGQPSKERRSQEASSTKGNELAIVPEDGSPEQLAKSTASRSSSSSSSSRPGDPAAGEYWTSPPLAEIKKMNKSQLKSVSKFIVGRENVGKCEFERTVDLSGINWDQFFGKLVNFEIRSICVYPEKSRKPPEGSEINVPSKITLENCWPRNRNVKSGPRLEKHLKHLQSVRDCQFLNYNVDTGDWVFRVPHFTTYALDDYDDGDDMDTDAPNSGSSVLSETFSNDTPDVVKTNGHQSTAPTSEDQLSGTQDSDEEFSAEEDTFGFKGVPGGFDLPGTEQQPEMQQQSSTTNPLSFLDERSVAESEDEDEPSDIPQGETEEVGQALVVQDEDMDLDMAGAFPDEADIMPKSILKHNFDIDRVQRVLQDDDWAEQLQRTISPRKRDRQDLRASQAVFFREADLDITNSPIKKGKSDNVRFETSIDVMNALFGKEELRKSTGGGNKKTVKTGFQWPYNKDVNADSAELDAQEQAFHKSIKPNWGPGEVLVHRVAEDATNSTNDNGLTLEELDLRLSKFEETNDLFQTEYVELQKRSEITVEDGVPVARPLQLSINSLVHGGPGRMSTEEARVWELASILFDKQPVVEGLTGDEQEEYADRILKDRLSTFWKKICQDDALKAVAASKSAEERAVHYLATGAVIEACTALNKGKDFRLATLVAQIGGDKILRQDMAEQINEWRRLTVLSEMSENIRTLYELLSGNVCEAQGKHGPLEDRASTFVISQKYTLDWKRSFGLRLWYAIGEAEPLQVAVKKYLDDLKGKETSKPKPTFPKDGRSWKDPNPDQREDVLFGLLRLFTDQVEDKHEVSLNAILAPENLSGNPVNYRLSWELYFALKPHFESQKDSDVAADTLTIGLASQLESAKSWNEAIFILLHLTNPQQRERSIRDMLARHGYEIQIPLHGKELFETFKLPQAWVYEALALSARVLRQDPDKELEYLQKAGNWNEAHSVLCSTIAPKAIIEENHSKLHQYLGHFETMAEHKPHSWRTGGAVYQDYLALLDTTNKTEHAKLLKRLLRSLPDMANASHGDKRSKGTAEKGSESEGFLRLVAAKEMGWVIGDMLLDDHEHDREHGLLLHLPLSSEMKRERSRELGMEYYRKVMALGA